MVIHRPAAPPPGDDEDDADRGDQDGDQPGARYPDGPRQGPGQAASGEVGVPDGERRDRREREDLDLDGAGDEPGDVGGGQAVGEVPRPERQQQHHRRQRPRPADQHGERSKSQARHRDRAERAEVSQRIGPHGADHDRQQHPQDHVSEHLATVVAA
ncbi:hypothetical protein ACFSTC_45050 [Nonomuraea ferruginea]